MGTHVKLLVYHW